MLAKIARVSLLAGVFFAACAGMVSGQQSVEEIRLTLAEALLRVEQENIQALIGREGVVEAMAIAQRQRAPLMPQVNLDATQLRSQVVNVGRGLDIPQWMHPPPTDRFDSRVSATVAVIDPMSIATYRAARLGVDVAEKNFESVMQDILDAAAQVYLSHLRNLKRFEVIESNIERGEVLLDLARRQMEAGVATQIDVTRAEVQLAFDRQTRLQQETVVYQSELLLKRMLNIDLRLPVAVTDFAANRMLPDEMPDADFEAMIEERPEYRRASLQLERNLLERRAANWERFPAVRLFGDYGFVSARALDGNAGDAWTVGVTATMPLFEGFRIAANRRHAESRIRATRHEIRDIEQEVSADLMLAWQNMRSRLAQMEVAQRNISLAEEETRLARIRFEQGVADNREVIDAQNRLAIAYDNYIEAEHQFNLARLAYARAKGNVQLILAGQRTPNSELLRPAR